MNIRVTGTTAFAMAVRDIIARFTWSLSEFDGEYDLIGGENACIIIPLNLVDQDNAELDTYGCYIQVDNKYFKPWSVYYKYGDNNEQWIYEF